MPAPAIQHLRSLCSSGQDWSELETLKQVMVNFHQIALSNETED